MASSASRPLAAPLVVKPGSRSSTRPSPGKVARPSLASSRQTRARCDGSYMRLLGSSDGTPTSMRMPRRPRSKPPRTASAASAHTVSRSGGVTSVERLRTRRASGPVRGSGFRFGFRVRHGRRAHLHVPWRSSAQRRAKTSQTAARRLDRARSGRTTLQSEGRAAARARGWPSPTAW